MKERNYTLESSVGYLIYVINQRMHDFYRKRLQKEGINVLEAWILLEVLNGVNTGNELKKSLRADAAQIQRASDRLIEEKWLVRTIAPQDKRVKILSLSSTGEALIKRVIRHSKETNRRALSDLSIDRQEELRTSLIEVLNTPFFQNPCEETL